MNVFRQLTRPTALWAMFVVVIALSASGLAMLSRHALDLSRQQQVSEVREDLQQDLRVALWRLDSRLGPYVATVHDAKVQNIIATPQTDEFILQRFAITRDNQTKGQGFQFTKRRQVLDSSMDMMMGMGMETEFGSERSSISSSNDSDAGAHWSRLEEEIPVESVVNAVEELLPSQEFQGNLIQNYAVQAPQSSVMQQSSLQQAASPDQQLRSQQALMNRIGIVEQQLNMNTAISMSDPSKAQGKPDTKWMSVWVNEHLIVVRSSRMVTRELEGVWVDWPELRKSLAKDIEDILPGASIHPVKPDDEIDPARTLAAIPAMIQANEIISISDTWSPTHTALSLAWMAFCFSVLIAGIALGRLIALSERRASFVSAVTHELRTPLTTFRLYSDLLARGMVSNAEDRQEYFRTLQREADRLTHLVDNVLRYSKLQGTSKAIALESVTLSDWVDRVRPRLESRLNDANMVLVVEQPSDGPWMTDPPAMEQVLFNLVDNAAKYACNAADRRVHLTAKMEGKFVLIQVSDHGEGVPRELRAAIFRPFAKSAERAAETAAGVGLGLALARQTATTLGGSLSYQQSEDGGASFLLRIPQG